VTDSFSFLPNRKVHTAKNPKIQKLIQNYFHFSPTVRDGLMTVGSCKNFARKIQTANAGTRSGLKFARARKTAERKAHHFGDFHLA
jgi:hypothetical protein